MIPEINYSTEYGGTEQNYRIVDGQLIYRSGDSELEFCLDLRQASYSIKRKRRFHRFWYVGLILVAAPLWTFGTIYLKDRVFLVGGMGWIHWGFLVVGLLLLLFYHRPTKCYEVRTGRRDRLWIVIDPTQPEVAEQLVEAIRQMRMDLS